LVAGGKAENVSHFISLDVDFSKPILQYFPQLVSHFKLSKKEEFYFRTLSIAPDGRPVGGGRSRFNVAMVKILLNSEAS
jgi:hypothetical protein